ncbi:MAG: hypothetical protein ACE5F8_05140 [Woeseiaceae bacterium]
MKTRHLFALAGLASAAAAPDLPPRSRHERRTGMASLNRKNFHNKPIVGSGDNQ